ncbi:MAG: hypothetical protein Q9219_005941 [cf. Caloplaca sp. 3 TL-2023]
MVSSKSIALPQERIQLQTSHRILGVLHIIHEMTRVNEFFGSTSLVMMHMQPLGSIIIHAARPERPFHDLDHTTLTDSLVNNTQQQNLTARRTIIDPDYDDFTITYEVTGDPMTCIDVLSTILYAVATAAQGASNQFCRDLGGYNEKRSAVYQIHGIRHTQSMHLLGYGMVRSGLSLLGPKLYDTNACGEVEFSFLYQGDVLGGGLIRLSDFAADVAR